MTEYDFVTEYAVGGDSVKIPDDAIEVEVEYVHLVSPDEPNEVFVSYLEPVEESDD